MDESALLLLLGAVVLQIAIVARLKWPKKRRQEEARLVATDGPLRGRSFRFAELPLVLGRNPEVCDVILPNPRVSREHASLWVEADHVIFVNLSRTNRSFVNGLPVDRTYLKDGDVLTIGASEFVLEHGGQLE